MGSLREALAAVRASQDQLVETERLQAVGTLAAGVTHYVNNVLQAVLGSAQLLLQDVQEPKSRKRLETLERSAMEAAAIMRRVKAFAEATTLSGAMPLDLNQLVRDLLGASGAPWAPPWPTRDDRAGLRAGRDPGGARSAGATPRGARGVDPQRRRSAARRGRIRSDVGHRRGRLLRGRRFRPGMSDEVRHRACEPFFTTKGPRHQGLGLSLAYGIIRRHRGELEIPRDEGQGGLVTFHLPPHRHTAVRP